MSTTLAPFSGLAAGNGNTYTASLGTSNYTTTGTKTVSMAGSQLADDSSTPGAGGNKILSGSGVLFAHTEYVGKFGSGTFNQSGRTNTTSAALSLGGGGTYNLAGGALFAPGIQRRRHFQFRRRTLAATASFSTSQAMTLTGSGGNSNISTGGCAVTLSGPLSGPGGLNKLDAGALTLSGSNTYAGGTTVAAGVLKLDFSQRVRQRPTS